jgi:hypothetical protein
MDKYKIKSNVFNQKPKVVYSKDHQIGKSIFKIDIKRKALAPGKRISKNNKVYYEYRANRSDSHGNY